jgi:hypothetical protein
MSELLGVGTRARRTPRAAATRAEHLARRIAVARTPKTLPSSTRLLRPRQTAAAVARPPEPPRAEPPKTVTLPGLSAEAARWLTEGVLPSALVPLIGDPSFPGSSERPPDPPPAEVAAVEAAIAPRPAASGASPAAARVPLVRARVVEHPSRPHERTPPRNATARAATEAGSQTRPSATVAPDPVDRTLGACATGASAEPVPSTRRGEPRHESAALRALARTVPQVSRADTEEPGNVRAELTDAVRRWARGRGSERQAGTTASGPSASIAGGTARPLPAPPSRASAAPPQGQPPTERRPAPPDIVPATGAGVSSPVGPRAPFGGLTRHTATLAGAAGERAVEREEEQGHPPDARPARSVAPEPGTAGGHALVDERTPAEPTSGAVTGASTSLTADAASTTARPSPSAASPGVLARARTDVEGRTRDEPLGLPSTDASSRGAAAPNPTARRPPAPPAAPITRPKPNEPPNPSPTNPASHSTAEPTTERLPATPAAAITTAGAHTHTNPPPPEAPAIPSSTDAPRPRSALDTRSGSPGPPTARSAPAEPGGHPGRTTAHARRHGTDSAAASRAAAPAPVVARGRAPVPTRPAEPVTAPANDAAPHSAGPAARPAAASASATVAAMQHAVGEPNSPSGPPTAAIPRSTPPTAAPPSAKPAPTSPTADHTSAVERAAAASCAEPRGHPRPATAPARVVPRPSTPADPPAPAGSATAGTPGGNPLAAAAPRTTASPTPPTVEHACPVQPATAVAFAEAGSHQGPAWAPAPLIASQRAPVEPVATRAIEPVLRLAPLSSAAPGSTSAPAPIIARHPAPVGRPAHSNPVTAAATGPDLHHAAAPTGATTRGSTMAPPGTPPELKPAATAAFTEPPRQPEQVTAPVRALARHQRAPAEPVPAPASVAMAPHTAASPSRTTVSAPALAREHAPMEATGSRASAATSPVESHHHASDEGWTPAEPPTSHARSAASPPGAAGPLPPIAEAHQVRQHVPPPPVLARWPEASERATAARRRAALATGTAAPAQIDAARVSSAPLRVARVPAHTGDAVVARTRASGAVRRLSAPGSDEHGDRPAEPLPPAPPGAAGMLAKLAEWRPAGAHAVVARFPAASEVEQEPPAVPSAPPGPEDGGAATELGISRLYDELTGLLRRDLLDECERRGESRGGW